MTDLYIPRADEMVWQRVDRFHLKGGASSRYAAARLPSTMGPWERLVVPLPRDGVGERQSNNPYHRNGLGQSCVGPLAVLDEPAKGYDSNSRDHPSPPPTFMCAKAGMTSCWSGLRICCPSKRQRPQLTLRLPSCRSRLASSSFVPLLIIILWVLVSFFSFFLPVLSFSVSSGSFSFHAHVAHTDHR